MSNNEILHYIRLLNKQNKNINRKINILINNVNKVNDNFEELKNGYSSNDSFENSPAFSYQHNKMPRHNRQRHNDEYSYQNKKSEELSSSSDESMEPLKAEYTIYKAKLPDIKTFKGRR